MHDYSSKAVFAFLFAFDVEVKFEFFCRFEFACRVVFALRVVWRKNNR